MTLRPVGEEQVLLTDLDSAGAKRVDLGEQGLGSTTTPAPMTPVGLRKTPEGTRCTAKWRVAELDGVPGVVAAVVAGDDVEAVGQQVDDLALAFVAPLPAEHRDDSHRLPLQNAAR